MFSPTNLRKIVILSIVLTAGFSSLVQAQKAQQKEKAGPQAMGKPVAWRDPGDISTLNLRHGPGSEEMAPQAPFTFISESKTGASPKFKVKDARGVTWSVKMGPEAQAETVATRLVWAMGYFADEAYHFDRIEVQNLRLSRGKEFQSGNTVRDVRLEPRREGESRGEIWDWLQNPFVGQREFNGLKVLMVLIANYDTRLDNNQIYTVKHPVTGELEARYVVTDIGATFGKVGGLGGTRTKNSLEDFRSGKFVESVENGMVNFDYHTKPKGAGGAFASIFGGGYAKRQANKEKAMRSIPLNDAQWMGTRLALLSDEQLRDAFRAAHYDNATMEGYVSILRGRINELTRLPIVTPVVAEQNPKN